MARRPGRLSCSTGQARDWPRRSVCRVVHEECVRGGTAIGHSFSVGGLSAGERTLFLTHSFPPARM